ncbi:MAG TPA: OB-fold domain-containing protein [Acidimicrobiales bacterium]|nr:OB-fold domain-containing protein [Acidimicrobiales bacterium]
MMRPDFPLPDTEWEPTRPFWAAAAAGELRIPRCDACQRLHWYPRAACRRCGARDFTWETMSGRATLFSWVVVTHTFLPQFGEKVPFVPGLVALEEDPAVRLTTEIVDGDTSALRFDMPLTVVFRPITFAGVDGSVVAPLFTPA